MRTWLLAASLAVAASAVFAGTAAAADYYFSGPDAMGQCDQALARAGFPHGAYCAGGPSGPGTADLYVPDATVPADDLSVQGLATGSADALANSITGGK